MADWITIQNKKLHAEIGKIKEATHFPRGRIAEALLENALRQFEGKQAHEKARLLFELIADSKKPPPGSA